MHGLTRLFLFLFWIMLGYGAAKVLTSEFPEPTLHRPQLLREVGGAQPYGFLSPLGLVILAIVPRRRLRRAGISRASSSCGEGEERCWRRRTA